MSAAENAALANGLNGLLPSVIALAMKSHGYHWNIIGTDFQEYHELFGDIYEDIDGSVDPMAENIRKLGSFPLFLVNDIAGKSVISTVNAGTRSADLAQNLLNDNETVLSIIASCLKLAAAADQQGILNFLADRQDMHQKWSWQLRASLGQA